MLPDDVYRRIHSYAYAEVIKHLKTHVAYISVHRKIWPLDTCWVMRWDGHPIDNQELGLQANRYVDRFGCGCRCDDAGYLVFDCGCGFQRDACSSIAGYFLSKSYVWDYEGDNSVLCHFP